MKPADLIPTSRIQSKNYIRLRIPNHPSAGKDGYVYEHRFVVEVSLGRFLSDDEIVHHKNENTADNRIENLEVMSDGDHSSHHHSLKVEIICPSCGNKFYRPPCRTKNRKASHCSRECLHEALRGVKKISVVGRPKIGQRPLVHGTSVAYGYHKCRCDQCREGQRIRLGAYRKKSPGIT